jgi:hypothetical protein
MKFTGAARLIYENLFATIVEDSISGQIFVSHVEDLPPEVREELWDRFEIGYEVTSQHFDVDQKRECFFLDRIKP